MGPRLAAAVVGTALVATACTGGNGSGTRNASATTSTTRPADPHTTLVAAAKSSVGTARATFRGALVSNSFSDDFPVVTFTGAVDFRRRRTAVTIRTGPNEPLRYPPYEMRFVDGVTYIEIDRVVARAPGISRDAQWVAFTTRPTCGTPIPNEAVPASFPLRALQWPLNQRAAGAAFMDPPRASPRRVRVAFPGLEGKSRYTYGIDGAGRVASVLALDAHKQAARLHYTYGTAGAPITAPTVGVQRLSPGENLCRVSYAA